MILLGSATRDEEPCERGLGGRLEAFGEASGSVDPKLVYQI